MRRPYSALFAEVSVFICIDERVNRYYSPGNSADSKLIIMQDRNRFGTVSCKNTGWVCAREDGGGGVGGRGVLVAA